MVGKKPLLPLTPKTSIPWWWVLVSFVLASGALSVVTASTNPPSLVVDRRAELRLQGATGMVCRVECSTDPAAGTSWTALTNLTLPSDELRWFDAASGGEARRFYRLVATEGHSAPRLGIQCYNHLWVSGTPGSRIALQYADDGVSPWLVWTNTLLSGPTAEWIDWGSSDQASRRYRVNEEVRLLTEDNPPFNFRDATGALTGQSVEIVQALLRRMEVSAPIDLLPWSDAYQETLTETDTALFTTALSESRRALFQWVGPIGTSERSLIGKTGSEFMIGGLADARSARGISVVQDDIAHQYLLAQGFTNLVAVARPADGLGLLLSGQVALWVQNPYGAYLEALAAGISPTDLEVMCSVKQESLYIAFNLSTPPWLVAQWQRTLDELKADGTMAAIADKYADLRNPLVQLVQAKIYQVLSPSPLFKGLSREEIDQVLPLCRLMQYPPGEHLIRLNAALDRLFILRAGQAGVYVGARGDTLVATLGADSLLGEMEFVDHQPASAEVVMLTSGEAVEIGYAPLRALCESAPLVGYRLLSNIAEIISLKLRATNAQLAPSP